MVTFTKLFAVLPARCRLGVLLPLWMILTGLSNAAAAENPDGRNLDVGRGSECVVALHGLARSAASMKKLVTELEQAGYSVANIDYPSRKFTISELAHSAVATGLDSCEQHGAEVVHFVSHSMGGILIRQYLETQSIEHLGRVVMLAPPNQGSEVVDALRDTPGFELLNGPAGLQLGTDAGSIPSTLGPATFDLGVVAGTRSINLLLSTYLPDPDDGKVSVASARLQGMCDFLAVGVSHPFIMRDDDVIEQVIHYLSNGQFSRDSDSAVESEENSSALPRHCSAAGKI